jgi:hypothetical protein
MDIEYLRNQLDYDSETGIFRWNAPRPKVIVGSIAGTTTEKGGIRIGLDGKYYHAHRLAWFHYYGVWPNKQIDHRNLNKSDNRIENLREATNGQNCANRRSFGASGIKGVREHSGKWHAQITFNKRCRSLGYYNTPEEARSAYAEAASRLHGEFARIE